MSSFREPVVPSFRLSPRGSETILAFRAEVGPVRGFERPLDFEYTRAQWADAYGLELGDEAYLVELAVGTQTLHELGDGMAVFGQSQGMIARTVERLVDLGFVERLAEMAGDDSGQPASSADSA